MHHPFLIILEVFGADLTVNYYFYTQTKNREKYLFF